LCVISLFLIIDLFDGILLFFVISFLFDFDLVLLIILSLSDVCSLSLFVSITVGLFSFCDLVEFFISFLFDWSWLISLLIISLCLISLLIISLCLISFLIVSTLFDAISSDSTFIVWFLILTLFVLFLTYNFLIPSIAFLKQLQQWLSHTPSLTFSFAYSLFCLIISSVLN